MTDYGIDVSVAHPARRYNYWLGGKDNFEADRLSGDQIANAFPHIRTAASENRAFLARAVRYLAEEQRVRQFLDIGTGLPTVGNTHEVAALYRPDARVVYVDNDPIVLVHARALLTAQPPAQAAYIDADLREPHRILREARATGILDLGEPIALMLIAVLHFIPADRTAYDVVARLVDALPSGSFLALSHASYDLLDDDTITKLGKVELDDFTPRTREQTARFFDGLHVVAPGLQVVSEWQRNPENQHHPDPDQVSVFGAVAYKP
jgi:hypothetical protein